MKLKPSTSKKGLTGLLRTIHIRGQTIILLGLFIVLIIFFSVTEENFLTTRAITSMVSQLAEVGVLTLAMMITMLIGGINLSTIATANLAAILAGSFMVKLIPQNATQVQIVLYLAIALLIALLVGLISGIINGFLTGYLGVNSILATLATLSLYTGISTGLTGGKTVTGFPEQLSKIGSQELLGIPMPFVIFIFMTILAHVLVERTPFGFKACMLGSNPIASDFSGVDNKSITMKIHLISGIYSAVAGILIMSRTMSAAYEYGRTYLLLILLTTVLANIMPGFGSMIDVFISVCILQILSTGFHMTLAGMHGSAFFKDFSWGILLILILIIRYSLASEKKE